MSDTPLDLMKIWTQRDPESERLMAKMLLEGLDEIVQSENDTLSKIRVGDIVSSPVIRWMEEWGYPSQVTAQLTGNNLTFSGHVFGRTIDAESTRKVIRAGTILERPPDGVQAKVVSPAGLSASVEGYGNTNLSDDSQPLG